MAASEVYEFVQGDTPLLVSMPHVGALVPNDILERMTLDARRLPDTDWYVHKLYDFLREMGVSTIQANYSRYVVDLNRSADGESLYPGRSVTELCPTTLFNRQPIYRQDCAPSQEEVIKRTRRYWQPYHTKLKQELARIKDHHGYALLWDAHSIRSEVPRFFDGKLPDFNWGTASGDSCDAALTEALLKTTAKDGIYSSVLNGRFKGGFITRDNGSPPDGIQAIQLELSQATYMADEETHEYCEDKANQVKTLLIELVGEMLIYKPSA
ncbi:N-formylglutamate deformylase [Pseudomaricurvus alkylphenolicus]|uniref:N-formylglutamate deformylase n=1 Tax=Pseudomaricurvus alkylphenolicus TaxID=1306991 RepID=UPI001423A2A4|nr:N-formylglutamate deformylase [Pseudomaricurvus alkylphenolicus]NIB45047.1 N-formylglutamate deformylase [Pseudomaricurvus alkylphenolicus]